MQNEEGRENKKTGNLRRFKRSKKPSRFVCLSLNLVSVDDHKHLTNNLQKESDY